MWGVYATNRHFEFIDVFLTSYYGDLYYIIMSEISLSEHEDNTNCEEVVIDVSPPRNMTMLSPENVSNLSIGDSAILAHLQNEHNAERQSEIDQNTWQSCCFRLDKRAVQYFTRVSVCIATMVFCGVKMATEPELSPVYSGMFSFSLGILFPSPKIE